MGNLRHKGLNVTEVMNPKETCPDSSAEKVEVAPMPQLRETVSTLWIAEGNLR